MIAGRRGGGIEDRSYYSHILFSVCESVRFNLEKCGPGDTYCSRNQLRRCFQYKVSVCIPVCDRFCQHHSVGTLQETITKHRRVAEIKMKQVWSQQGGRKSGARSEEGVMGPRIITPGTVAPVQDAVTKLYRCVVEI